MAAKKLGGKKRKSTRLQGIGSTDDRPLLQLGSRQFEVGEDLIAALADMIAEEMKTRGLLSDESKKTTERERDEGGAA